MWGGAGSGGGWGVQHTAGAYSMLAKGRALSRAHTQGLVPCLPVENMAHCEFPLLRDLLIR